MGYGGRLFGEKEFLPRLCTPRLSLRAMRVGDVRICFPMLPCRR